MTNRGLMIKIVALTTAFLFMASSLLVSVETNGTTNPQEQTIQPTYDVSDLNYVSASKLSENKMNMIESGKIIVIENEWIATQDRNSIQKIISLGIASNVPIVSLSKNSLFMESVDRLVPCSFTDDSNIYAIYKDGETSNIYLFETNAQGADAILSLKNWLNEIKTNPDLGYVIVNGSWGDRIISIRERVVDGWGRYNVKTQHQYLVENNMRYNYYAGVYSIEIHPEENRRISQSTAYIELYNNPSYETSRHLDSYFPTGTVGSGSVTGSIGFNIGIDTNLNASISITNNYTDITISDNSYTLDNIVDITHNFDKNSDIAKNNCILNIGQTTVVDCESGSGWGDFMSHDTFTVTFAKKVSTWYGTSYWSYHTDSMEIRNTWQSNPCTITIDGNGADGNVYDEEDENDDYAGPTHSWTCSQGSYVVLYNEGYYKNGYSFLGYSLESNSSTAQYQIGQTVRITNDTHFYYVWQED